MTKKLTCFIVDDEPASADYLRSLVVDIRELQLLGVTNSPFEALAFLESNDVDLIFVDISMRKMTGFKLGEYITDSRIIWVTWHKDFALQSFEHPNTVDYLVKPVEVDRLKMSIKKAIHFESIKVKENEARGFLNLTHLGQRNIPYAQIDYIEASRNGTTVICKNEKVIIPLPLKEVLELLPVEQFIQIHRSHIVNKDKIVKVRYNNVEFINKMTLPVGRSFRKFLDA